MIRLSKPSRLMLALIFSLLINACTIKNRNVAGEQATFMDTDWMLLSVGNQEVTVDNDTRTSFIHFDSEKNKVKGFAGCNSFFGRYEHTDNRLQLSELGSTRVSCPDMDLETRLMQALEKVTSYSISGQILTLYQNNNAVATFRAAYGQPLHQEPGR